MSAQLSLLAELDLELPKDSAPSRPTRKFTAPPSLPYALVLLALLSGPAPLEKLQLLAGVHDGIKLIADLRQLGLMLPCHDVPAMDGHGYVHCRTVCMLSATDTRRVNRWIKNSGVGYA